MPLQIDGATLTNDSNFDFVFKNANADPITLLRIKINHGPTYITERGSTGSGSIYFGPGETKVIDVRSTTFNCIEGNTGMLEISITYQTQYGTTLTETSDKKFAMKCNMDSGGGTTPYTCGTTEGTCPEGMKCCIMCYQTECPIYWSCNRGHICVDCPTPSGCEEK